MNNLLIDPAMLRDRPIDEVVQAVAAEGYRAIEWSPREDFLPAGRPPQASLERIEQLRKVAGREGVVIAALAAFYDWSSPDEAVRRVAVTRFRRALEISHELGCGHLTTELKGDVEQATASEKAFRKSVEELLPIAERYGIQISVEPHPFDFIESSDRAVDLVRSVGSSTLGYLYCAPHTFVMGTDAAAMVAHAGSQLSHVHLADSFRSSRYIVNPQGTGVRVHQHLDLGLGEVDFSALFHSLDSIGYEGLLSVAVFAHAERARKSFRANRERVAHLAANASVSMTEFTEGRDATW